MRYKILLLMPFVFSSCAFIFFTGMYKSYDLNCNFHEFDKTIDILWEKYPEYKVDYISWQKYVNDMDTTMLPYSIDSNNAPYYNFHRHISEYGYISKQKDSLNFMNHANYKIKDNNLNVILKIQYRYTYRQLYNKTNLFFKLRHSYYNLETNEFDYFTAWEFYTEAVPSFEKNILPKIKEILKEVKEKNRKFSD